MRFSFLSQAKRRQLYASLFVSLISFISIPLTPAQAEIVVTDIVGREVRLKQPARHVILGEGRFLPSLAILDGKDVFKRVVGLSGDFKKYDPASYAQYQKYYPEIDAIPLIGSGASATFSVEQAFHVKPDIAIFGLGSGHGPNDKSKAIIDQFEAAGIPVVIVDFRMEPVENTPKSIRLLGELLGKEKRAEEFLTFYEEKIALIQKRLGTVTTRPSVFIEPHVGMRTECCSSFGNAMMGRLVTLAGGQNAYGDMIPGTAGMVNVEHLITHQPDIYIGTAIGSLSTIEDLPKAIALGVGVDKETARASLIRSTNRFGIKQLKAIQAQKAYGVWHHFYNTPMHIAATEAMAKWFHPDLFKDLNPTQSLQEYFDRFQPVPLEGEYWIALNDNRLDDNRLDQEVSK